MRLAPRLISFSRRNTWVQGRTKDPVAAPRRVRPSRWRLARRVRCPPRLVRRRAPFRGFPVGGAPCFSGKTAGQDGPLRGVAASRLGSEILAATPPRVLRSRALETCVHRISYHAPRKVRPRRGRHLLRIRGVRNSLRLSYKMVVRKVGTQSQATPRSANSLRLLDAQDKAQSQSLIY